MKEVTMPGTPAVHWVVVANASRARVFAADLFFATFESIEDRIHPSSRMRDQQLVSSAPGRSYASPGGNHTAFDRHTDPHDVEVERFARELADLLDEARKAERYERLVLVAPPKFLGLLRETIDANTARTVIGSIARDWSASKPSAVAAHVRDIAAAARWGEAS
jgi:protein required for attachment to host cells